MKADESRAYTNGFADGFKRGREDAIDECIRELAKMSDCKNSLLIRLEQMKEKKDD